MVPWKQLHTLRQDNTNERELVVLAGIVAALGWDDGPIGHNRVDGFLQRHPDVNVKASQFDG